MRKLSGISMESTKVIEPVHDLIECPVSHLLADGNGLAALFGYIG